MLLSIDAGNTNIVFAVYEGEQQRGLWRCETDPGKAAEDYASWFTPLLPQAAIDAVFIASVVPDVNASLTAFCETTFNCTPVFVNHETAGIPVELDAPEECGADRLANAVTIVNEYPYPAVVIDFGTATTFDVVNERGSYCGGMIAPGVNLSLEALHRAAAKLPEIKIVKPKHVIGKNTIDAMQAGIYWGYVGLIEGILERIEQELGTKPFVLATGGLAHLFADAVPSIEKVDDSLTLRGLLHVYRANPPYSSPRRGEGRVSG